MLLAITASLAFGFTVVSVIFKKGWLAYSAAAIWIISSIHCFSEHTVTWDTYFSLGFLFIFLMVVCTFSPLAYKEKGGETEDPDVAEMRAEMSEFNKYRNQYSFLNRRRR